MRYKSLLVCLVALAVSFAYATDVGVRAEAPGLAQIVSGGSLPPVVDRLPANPLVVETVDEVGTYGGTWRLLMVGPADRSAAVHPLLGEPLVRWSRDGTTVVPNVAQAVEVSSDGRSFEFSLREGMRWSDGEPVSAADVVFWFEGVVKNSDLTPAFPAWLGSSETTTVEAIDDYRVRFAFAESNVLFLQNVAFFGAGGASWRNVMIQPKHYLAAFHPEYADVQSVERLTSEGGFTDWTGLFDARADRVMNVDVPVLSAWSSTEIIQGQRITFTRNPYYWKIDAEGQQLPYIDNVQVAIVENLEVAKARIAAGEVHTDFTHITLPDYPFFQESAARGNYRVHLWDSGIGANFALWPNLNHEDPVKNALFNDHEVRIALSIGINREELNLLYFLGLAEPRQATTVPGTPYHQDDLPGMYAEFDPEEANRLLDGAGLDQRDGSGYRLRPDGRRLELTIEYTPFATFGPWDDIAQRVADYWNDLGLRTEVISRERSFYQIRSNAPEIDFTVWSWGRANTPLLAPIFVFPSAAVGTSNGAPEFARWYYTGGEAGTMPDGDMLRVMEMYRDYSSEPDEARRIELGREIIRVATENVWAIGTVGASPFPVVVSNGFRNVPESSLREWLLLHYNVARPEQFFIQQ